MNELEKAEKRLRQYRPPYSDLALAKAKNSVMGRTIHENTTNNFSEGRSYARYYAAASLIFLLAIPFVIHVIGKTNLTAVEDSTDFTLPDGSEVLLAHGSTLTYNSVLWSFDRTTVLEGEGFFKVKSGHSFTVETDRGNVTVLGTQFSVWENSDALVVQCQEGSVRVADQVLSENDYLVVSPESTTSGKWENRERLISKEEGQLNFDNVPIQIVIESLEEKFDKDIRFVARGTFRFSGSLDNSDFNTSLQILTKPFGLKIATDNDGVVILEP